MDKTDVKRIFYRRYDSSKNFLHFTYEGALCSLLGHPGIAGAPALSCALSMGTAMFARRLEGNSVKLSNADSDRQLTYAMNTPPSLFFGEEREAARLICSAMREGCGGAEILFKSSAPAFAESRIEFNLALVRSLLKTSDIKKDKLETAVLAANGGGTDPYIALSYAENSCAVLTGMGEPKNFPMQLNGLKIIMAYCAQKDIDRAAAIQCAFEYIRRKYPSATLQTLTREQLDFAMRKKEHRAAVSYIDHLSKEACNIEAAIGAFSTETLINAMNRSQRSMEHCWHLRDEHRFLSECARTTDGVLAARCFSSGAVIIAENEMVNHAVSTIGREFENTIGYRPAFCITMPAYE